MREEWRSATTTSGAQSVMTHLVLLKLLWFAGSLAIPQLVSIVAIQGFFFVRLNPEDIEFINVEYTIVIIRILRMIQFNVRNSIFVIYHESNSA